MLELIGLRRHCVVGAVMVMMTTAAGGSCQSNPINNRCHAALSSLTPHLHPSLRSSHSSSYAAFIPFPHFHLIYLCMYIFFGIKIVKYGVCFYAV